MFDITNLSVGFTGIPLQQVPDQSAAYRDRISPPVERDPSEDLVPEQADEAEEEDEGGASTSGAQWIKQYQQLPDRKPSSPNYQ